MAKFNELCIKKLNKKNVEKFIFHSVWIQYVFTLRSIFHHKRTFPALGIKGFLRLGNS